MIIPMVRGSYNLQPSSSSRPKLGGFKWSFQGKKWPPFGDQSGLTWKKLTDTVYRPTKTPFCGGSVLSKSTLYGNIHGWKTRENRGFWTILPPHNFVQRPFIPNINIADQIAQTSSSNQKLRSPLPAIFFRGIVSLETFNYSPSRVRFFNRHVFVPY